MRKILVVEDTEELRIDVVTMLQLEGYEAIGAADGIEGVEIVRFEKPDLIICDVMMPRLDGFGMLEVLRSSPETSTIPVIFLTAKSERSSIRQGMSLGADDYLTKPFKISELLDSIDTQLRKRADLDAALNQRLEDLRQNIITALPHELRTPLNSIIGYSDMMIVEAPNLGPDQIATWAQTINSAGRRLQRLIDNYLTYARLQVDMQRADFRQQIEPLNELQNILEIEPYRVARLANRTDDLVSTIEPPPLVNVRYGDAVKIVAELVDNAFKFSQPGAPVHVSGYRSQDGYTVRIEDRGLGISDDRIATIGAYMQYERFIYEQQGMGLGLAIVKFLSELYGFALDISSEPDVGTTISVAFKSEKL